MYKIYEANYEKYIEVNGIKRSKNAQAKELKKNNSRYFIIEKDGEFFDDIYIFNDENWFCTDKNIILDSEIRKFVFEYLKNYYEYFLITIPFEDKSYYEKIKELLKVTEEYEITDVHNNIEYKHYKIIFDIKQSI